MACSFMTASASAASACGRMVLGRVLITCDTPARNSPSPIWRRKSPSVMTPAGQIPVGDGAGEPAFPVGDADAAEALGGHGQNRVAHGAGFRHQREIVADMHDVGHFQEAAAQLAPGMKTLEVARGES